MGLPDVAANRAVEAGFRALAASRFRQFDGLRSTGVESGGRSIARRVDYAFEFPIRSLSMHSVCLGPVF
jgi:hypothetical protein